VNIQTALTILALITSILAAPTAKTASVSPSGVTVKSFATNTVFLTYLGLNNQIPGEADEYVAVTCRLAGSGARVPFSITSVKLQVNGDKNAPAIAIGNNISSFGAQITYNGTGRLKGRWEVVLPGDPLPNERDLLTAASLPLEQRGLQRRYTELQRFDLFLQPTGSVFLPGSNPAKFPRGTTGTHLILLRIEATDDFQGNSNIGTGIVNSGGVAGFPMPIFRYSVSP
jgi:hypothetical protein